MIRISLDKAKEITHEKRRVARSSEFAPFDEVIAKQIPGASAAEAELARVAIREKYAASQVRIDAASSVSELILEVQGWSND
tara:strand:+ start:292 stop:537 length:246 start_codon:yes stop_codon:yes gene_type:complete